MADDAIACAVCSWPIPVEFWNREESARCRGCGHNMRAAVFPAIQGRRAGAVPEALGTETEASCFYHPESRAAIPCDECGRFLCGLCDLEVHGRHLCPGCFERGVSAQKIEVVETRRTMWDTFAILLATVPILFWPALFLTAPGTLFFIFRRWKTPLSVVPRTRIRYYLAALIALAEITGIVLIIYALVRTRVPVKLQ